MNLLLNNFKLIDYHNFYLKTSNFIHSFTNPSTKHFNLNCVKSNMSSLLPENKQDDINFLRPCTIYLAPLPTSLRTASSF